MIRALLLSLLLAAPAAAEPLVPPPAPGAVRIAVYNMALSRKGAGLAWKALAEGKDRAVGNALSVVAHVRPDVIAVLELDHDREGLALSALQAALAAPHGLRRFMGTTTVHRLYYDALPNDPLHLESGVSPQLLLRGGSAAAAPAGPAEEAWLRAEADAIALAREAHRRATTGPWAGPIEAALSATAGVMKIAAPFASDDSMWRCAPDAANPGPARA